MLFEGTFIVHLIGKSINRGRSTSRRCVAKMRESSSSHILTVPGRPSKNHDWHRHSNYRSTNKMV